MSKHFSVEHCHAQKDGCEIKLTVDVKPNGCYCITGMAFDESGVPIPKTKRVRNANNKKSINDKKQVVINLINNVLETAVQRNHRSTSADGLDESNPFVQAFRRVEESGNPINEKWSDDSRHAALTYFKRHILAFLQQFDGAEFLSSDREELMQIILKGISENLHSSGKDKTMLRTAQRRLIDADTIYEQMRKESPSLPNIRFSLGQKKKLIQNETIKHLPRAVRRRLERELEKRIQSEPEMVFGTVLMWDTGLRTGEAAAVIFELDIHFLDDNHAVVHVDWQEKNGVRSAILKTKNSYRIVPLSYWGITMLRNCVAASPKKEIDPEHKPIPAPRRARDLSAWIRELLTECGCSESFWGEALNDEQHDPDRDDDGNAIYDLVAYILRRERCGIWRNICGLSQLECDYFLGHAIRLTQSKRDDMRTDEMQLIVAKKLERFVYTPALSNHPYHSPIELKHGSKVDVIPYEAMRLVNHTGTKLKLEIDIVAEIVGEPITLILPAGSQVENFRRRPGKELSKRADKPVIGTGQEGISNGNIPE